MEPVQVDLKAKSDQFWRDLETYLKQAWHGLHTDYI